MELKQRFFYNTNCDMIISGYDQKVLEALFRSKQTWCQDGVTGGA